MNLIVGSVAFVFGFDTPTQPLARSGGRMSAWVISVCACRETLDDRVFVRLMEEGQ
jgi:hypothetical protein